RDILMKAVWSGRHVKISFDQLVMRASLRQVSVFRHRQGRRIRALNHPRRTYFRSGPVTTPGPRAEKRAVTLCCKVLGAWPNGFEEAKRDGSLTASSEKLLTKIKNPGTPIV